MRWNIQERLFGPWEKAQVLWLHGASLGECKVLLALAKRILEDFKNCPPILLTSQKTEVVDFINKKIRSDFSKHSIQTKIAPLPLNVIIKRFYKQVNPLCLILCENELWPAYLSAEKSRTNGSKLILVSGRFKRGAYLPKQILSPKAFAAADFQTELDQKRFSEKCPLLNSTVSGNWKLLSKKTKKSIHEKKYEVAFLSIHYSELTFLKNFFLNLYASNKAFIVAPRRLEETEKFSKFFAKIKIKESRFSNFSSNGVCLIDSFGQFEKFLPLSKTAVIGGSFKARPGIHDFYEPLLFGIPTYIGPFSYGQEEMVSRYFQAGILQKLPLRPCSLPNYFASSEEIIKFLEKEIYAVEQGYLKLRQQLSNWIVKNEKTDFS